jgi:hypothetical protein
MGLQTRQVRAERRQHGLALRPGNKALLSERSESPRPFVPQIEQPAEGGEVGPGDAVSGVRAPQRLPITARARLPGRGRHAERGVNGDRVRVDDGLTGRTRGSPAPDAPGRVLRQWAGPHAAPPLDGLPRKPAIPGKNGWRTRTGSKYPRPWSRDVMSLGYLPTPPRGPEMVRPPDVRRMVMRLTIRPVGSLRVEADAISAGERELRTARSPGAGLVLAEHGG